MKILGITNTDTKSILTIFNKKIVIKSAAPILEEIIQIWQRGGATSELITKITAFYNDNKYWNNVYKKMWLVYLSCLLEVGEEVQAKTVLKKYISNFKYSDIEKILSVSHFAYINGYASQKIKLSSEIFKKLETNKKNNELFNFLNRKRIAIVGNGSQLINSGKGKEIDSHDVVVRFNKYKISGFEKDCGRRTDMWVTIGNSFNRSEDIKFILLRHDYWHSFVDSKLLNKITKYTNLCCSFDPDCTKFARKCLNCETYLPTTGGLFIFSIYNMFGNFKNVDFYGFNFLEEKLKPLDHYYENVSKRHQQKAQEMHSFEEESAYLKQLIENDMYLCHNILV